MHRISLEVIIITCRAERKKGISMPASRYPPVVLASLGLLVVLWLMGGCGGGASAKKLEIADIGWTENTAIAHLTKVLLEAELDYEEVTIIKSDLDSVYDNVAKEDLDAF